MKKKWTIDKVSLAINNTDMIIFTFYKKPFTKLINSSRCFLIQRKSIVFFSFSIQTSTCLFCALIYPLDRACCAYLFSFSSRLFLMSCRDDGVCVICLFSSCLFSLFFPFSLFSISSLSSLTFILTFIVFLQLRNRHRPQVYEGFTSLQRVLLWFLLWSYRNPFQWPQEQ